jgi:two-component system, OmpR family, phosphate regulon sensor histidine kinase PhoR
VWTSKIFWKLLLVYTGLSVVLTVVFVTSISTWQRATAVDQAAQALEQTARGLIKATAARNLAELRTSLAEEVEAAQRDSRQSIVLTDEFGHVLAGTAVGRESLAAEPEVRSALAGSVSRAERAYDTGRLLHVAVPVRQGQSVIGALRISQDLAVIDKPIADTRRTLATIAILATIVAVTVTYFIVGRIVRPLAELTEGAQAIVDDERQNPLSLASSDELGVLGHALNRMQSKLAARVDQLNQNSERLASVLGNMAEGVIAVSTDENILLANEASRKLLEITVANPLGRPLLEVTRSLAVHAAFVEALQSASPVQREFIVSGPARRSLSLRAMRLPGEPCPGVMLVFHDVTELRRLENLRRDFVANVSHELKTPLASIKAYAETLKMGALNDPEHSLAFVGRIEEQAERLHQLILDLIHLARVESGQEAFEIVDVDLAEAVQDIVDQYSAAAAQKQITLEAIAPTRPVTARADEDGIRTILSNLVDNALKYTPAGGRVTLRWYADDQAAMLEVQDTGIGIAEKDQARIFERFYRVDRARSRELGGTGLGLAIVKHLAQAFGGSVGLDSVPKQGSTFRIRLPLARTANTVPPTAASS